MSIRKKLFRLTLIITIGLAISRFFVFIFRAFIARELSLDEFGQFSFIVQIFVTLVVIALFRISEAVTYHLTKNNNENYRNKFIFNAFLAVIPTSLISIITMIAVLGKYHLLSSYNILIFSMMILFSILHQINYGVIISKGRVKSLALIASSIGPTRLVAALILFVAFSVVSVKAALFAFTIGYFMPALISAIILFKDYRNIGIEFDMKIIIEIYSYAFFVTLSFFFKNVIFLIPMTVLSLSDFTGVAYFSMALTLFNLFNIIIMNIPLNTSFIITKEMKHRNKLPVLIDKWFLLLSSGFLLLIFLAMITGIDEFFVSLFIGAKYVPSLPIFHVLAISLPFYTITMVVSGVLMGINRVKGMALIDSLTVAFILILTYAGSGFGVLGISIIFSGVLICRSIAYLLTYSNIKKKYNS